MLQSIGTREEPKYPTTYDELEVKFDKEIRGRGIYCLVKDKQVFIEIRLVGIQIWDVVEVQIRKIKDNSKIDEGYAKIEYRKGPLVGTYTWAIPDPPEEEERQTIIGGYLAIVTAKLMETQNQYSAVRCLI